MQFTFDKVTVRHNNHSTVITSYNLDVTEKRQSGGSVTFSNVSRPYKNTASGLVDATVVYAQLISKDDCYLILC